MEHVLDRFTNEILTLRHGDHLCLIYDRDPAEQMGTLIPYIKEGLDAGECCIYVADDQTVADLQAHLVACGVDVDRASDAGALQLLTREDWRQPGALDSERKATQVRAMIREALDAGFSGVRFAVEMTWTLGPDVEPNRLRHWEATINTIFTPDLPARIVCQYSRDRLSPATIGTALVTHPTAILGGDVCANPFYDAPAVLSGDAQSEAEHVDWMIRQLRAAHTMERERAEHARMETLLERSEASREVVERLFRDAARARAAAEREAERLEALNRVSRVISGELDLERVMQYVTDAATSMTRAEFGAFFYNVVDEDGESYTLHVLSGADRKSFEGFPLPRNTSLFGATFRGEGTVRLADVTKDPRHGKNPPYNGLPPGHLPVRSYLAVPVVAGTANVLGGLFFGHSETDIFTEGDERLVESLAAQAAIAVENARLFQEAQRAIASRDQFLAVASHELKTPLTVLKGYAQLLQRRASHGELESPQVGEVAAQLVTYAGRLEDLIDDLLDTSRIQRDRLDLERVEMDLTALAASVVARFEDDPLCTPRHRLVLDASGPTPGRWDLGRLDQVLTNLLSNALKYSPDGGAVTVEVRRDADHAEVTVRDEGLGIPLEEQPNLFEPFHRGHAHQRVIPGSGLGLYISSQIAARHGGSLSVESEPGRGSAFRLRLPTSVVA